MLRGAPPSKQPLSATVHLSQENLDFGSSRSYQQEIEALQDQVAKLKAKVKELREDLYRSQSREKLLRRESTERVLDIEAQFELQLQNQMASLLEECKRLREEAARA